MKEIRSESNEMPMGKSTAAESKDRLTQAADI
jgi:hypothetical protein